MDSLKFRRQFLFSPLSCNQLYNWKQLKTGDYFLYVHPDCDLTSFNKNSLEIALIGYAIDPEYPNKNNKDILNNIASFKSIKEIPDKLYGLSGRFVLIIKKNNNFYFFHDACGLRQLFYTKHKEKLYAASQPLLLELVIKLKKGEKYYEYFNSSYVKKNKEHFLPSGISLYDNVYHLIPNHYLNFKKFAQIRYWPNKPIINRSLEDTVFNMSELLKNILFAANKRFKLALAITSGWDSRIILSACKDIADDLFFYTVKYGKLNESSADIKIPKRLFKKLGYRLHVIDCNKSVNNKEFFEIYKNNSDLSHETWSNISSCLYNKYPTERINIKGNCSEIGRCAYYHDGIKKNINSSKNLLGLINGWEQFNFVKTKLNTWFQDTNNYVNEFGIDLLDLMYWEHRMGSWQAQSQLEGDIIHETFTPFNNRKLLDIILQSDIKYRCGKNRYNHLYIKVMEINWKGVLSEPINPKTNFELTKSIIKNVFIKTGIYSLIKKLK